MRRSLPRVALLLAMAACEHSTTVAPDDGKLHVAVAGPMSGQYEVFGEQLRLGAEAAVQQLNGSGGVLGKQLVLEVIDDRCDPQRAARLANGAVADRTVLVDGHFCSGTSIQAAPVYEKAGIVMISPASTNPALTEQGRSLIFRVVQRDSDQGRFAADYVLDNRPGDRIATVHDGSMYGKTLVTAFTDRVRQRGGEIAGAYSIASGAGDYPSLIADLRAEQIDLIYFGGYHTEAAAIARGAAEAGLGVQIVGADALVDKAFWADAGAAGEGTLMAFVSDPRLAPAAQDAVAAFRARGTEPEGYVLYSYAAVQVWAEAAARAGDVRGDAIADTLRSGVFPTVIGDLRFDARGDVEGGPPWLMHRWSAGQYAPVTAALEPVPTRSAER